MAVTLNEAKEQESATPSAGAHPAPYELSGRLYSLSEPHGVVAEAFSAVRNHVLSAHLRLGRRSLTMCAASPNVGCTFAAANLAVAMAQVGVKTLLIDGNFREPGLDEYFRSSTSNQPGLLHALSDPDLPLGDAIRTEVIPNLSLMHAGGVAETPQALLAGTSFRSLIDASLRDFDLTLIDTPPATAGDDSRRIASLLRYAMVVVRREKSRLADVKRLAADLNSNRAEVIGTFLNDF